MISGMYVCIFFYLKNVSHISMSEYVISIGIE